MVSPGILYGIVALLGWGLADFFAKRLVDRFGDLKALFWIQALSLVPFATLYFIVDGRLAFAAADYLFFAVISLFSIVGYIFFYRAIKLGNISIMSPIQATVIAGTLILAALVLHERLAALEYAAIGILFIGLMLTGVNITLLRKTKRVALFSGVKENLISVVLFSVHFILLGIIIPKHGWLAPIFFFRAFNVLFLLSYMTFTRSSIAFPKKITRTSSYLIPITAIADVAAIIFFSLGVNSEYVSIVTPVASSFPLVTVTLALIFYKEKLDKIQIAGILLLISGIAFLAAVS